MEEQRIRRENLIKDFVMILGRKSDHIEFQAKKGLIDALYKCHKVYDVHLEYANELRETSLKTRLISNWKAAIQKYKFRSKLVKNFARVLERCYKPKFDEVFQEAIKRIKTIKRIPQSRSNKISKQSPNLNKTQNLSALLSGTTNLYSSITQTGGTNGYKDSL